MSIPAWVTNFLGAASAAATTYSAVKSTKTPAAPKMPQVQVKDTTPKPETVEQRVTDAGELAAETTRRKAARRRGYMSTLLTPLGQNSVATGVRKTLLGG